MTLDSGSLIGRTPCAVWQSVQVAVTVKPLLSRPFPCMLSVYRSTIWCSTPVYRTAAFSPLRWQRPHRAGMFRAKVGEWVVTERAGKPVEVQALWLNALKIASGFSPGWADVFDRGLRSFRKRFWNEANGCLYDVVDVNHRQGEIDATFRPNQILAVGGLPISLLETEQALHVVAAVEARLWVPLGLRSLARAGGWAAAGGRP